MTWILCTSWSPLPSPLLFPHLNSLSPTTLAFFYFTNTPSSLALPILSECLIYWKSYVPKDGRLFLGTQSSTQRSNQLNGPFPDHLPPIPSRPYHPRPISITFMVLTIFFISTCIHLLDYFFSLPTRR